PSSNRTAGWPARANPTIADEKSSPTGCAPPLGNCGGGKPGSAGQIEDAHSCADTSGIEQVVDEPACCLSEGRGIVRCRPLPTGMLEGADGLGVKSRCHAA